LFRFAELVFEMWEETLPPLLLIFVGRHSLYITPYVCVCACACACEVCQSFGWMPVTQHP